MEIFAKYFAKLFFKKWSVGIAKADLADMIRGKKKDFNFTWLETDNIGASYADPFAYINNEGKVHIIAEQFTTGNYDGKICRISYDANKGFSQPETLLDIDSHYSYPSLYEEENKVYVLAENAFHEGVNCFEYKDGGIDINSKKTVIDMPLLDATVLKNDGKYWLFATQLGKDQYTKLYIYYADDFFGPYKPHAQNPVKNSIDGSRPAGHFIKVDGEIYRPSQNCGKFYGESIAIQKIIKLTATEYEEVLHMEIKPDKKSSYNMGIHTINTAGEYIVVDGQKGYFQPVLQILRAIKRVFGFNKTKLCLLFCGYKNLLIELQGLGEVAFAL
jgi:hypothetical protein